FSVPAPWLRPWVRKRPKATGFAGHAEASMAEVFFPGSGAAAGLSPFSQPQSQQQQQQLLCALSADLASAQQQQQEQPQPPAGSSPPPPTAAAALGALTDVLKGKGATALSASPAEQGAAAGAASTTTAGGTGKETTAENSAGAAQEEAARGRDIAGEPWVGSQNWGSWTGTGPKQTPDPSFEGAQEAEAFLFGSPLFGAAPIFRGGPEFAATSGDASDLRFCYMCPNFFNPGTQLWGLPAGGSPSGLTAVVENISGQSVDEKVAGTMGVSSSRAEDTASSSPSSGSSCPGGPLQIASGHTENRPSATTLTIGSVPGDYSQEELQRVLKPLGVLYACNLVYLPYLMSDSVSFWNAGYAFLNYWSPEDAEAARTGGLHGTLPFGCVAAPGLPTAGFSGAGVAAPIPDFPGQDLQLPPVLPSSVAADGGPQENDVASDLKSQSHASSPSAPPRVHFPMSDGAGGAGGGGGGEGGAGRRGCEEEEEDEEEPRKAFSFGPEAALAASFIPAVFAESAAPLPAVESQRQRLRRALLLKRSAENLASGNGGTHAPPDVGAESSQGPLRPGRIS
ncbi:unnamed protein product, partial [Polarella glacialis]